ncbi:MAG: copper resistance protein B [Phenylobacterium sp.]|nr:copper resistance protein B [Phenylobacterium sp.]
MKPIMFPAALALSLLAGPAFTQTPDLHAGHTMAPTPAPKAGVVQPAPAPADPHAGHVLPARPVDPHSRHTVSAPPPDPHAGHGAQATLPAPSGTGGDLPIGSAPPPPVASDNLADRYFSAEAMSRARNLLKAEHGGTRVSKVMTNIAEAQSGPGGGGYRWDVEGWYGGDLNRVVIKTEGEGGRGGGLEFTETQLLFSRAVGRYTDFQVGVRHDVRPRPQTTYATVSVEALLPYWWETEAALFLSEDGDLRGRVEAWYDLRLTQRVVLQTQAEVGFSAQDIRTIEVGSGITHAELGLRLRYEIRREFAPYVGVSYERSLGRTAHFARAAGERPENITFVAGIRSWF